ncbi:hypothetical protein OAS86_02690 [Gammaproteobacteria bacterium]|nr:hypothetical protein [Gammaproteobacteria bacterium]
MTFLRACQLAGALCIFLTLGMVLLPVQMMALLGIVINEGGAFWSHARKG